MSLSRRVECNAAEQQTDIINPTNESHLALQLLSNYSLIRSEVEKQLFCGVYLDVQYCPDSLDLEFQYCEIESPDDLENIFKFTVYGDILVDYFRTKFGLSEIATNELDAVHFAKHIIDVFEPIKKDMWAFVMIYALQAISKMEDSAKVEATKIITTNTYEETSFTVLN